MKKIIITLFITLSIIFIINVTSVYGQSATLLIPHKIVKSDSTVLIDIVLENSVKITGIQAEIFFDKTILSTSSTKFEKTTRTSHMILNSSVSSNKATFILYSLQEKISVGYGSILTVEFNVGDVLSQKNLIFEFGVTEIYDENRNPISVSKHNGIIAILPKYDHHFNLNVINTGYKSDIIIISDNVSTINNNPIEKGDEIGIFTPRGKCAGYGVWDDDDLTITVWGNNRDSEILGFENNELFEFRIWDSSNKKEIEAIAIFSNGDGTYNSDKVFIISSLKSVDDSINLYVWVDNYGHAINSNNFPSLKTTTMENLSMYVPQNAIGWFSLNEIMQLRYYYINIDDDYWITNNLDIITVNSYIESNTIKLQINTPENIPVELSPFNAIEINVEGLYDFHFKNHIFIDIPYSNTVSYESNLTIKQWDKYIHRWAPIEMNTSVDINKNIISAQIYSTGIYGAVYINNPPVIVSTDFKNAYIHRFYSETVNALDLDKYDTITFEKLFVPEWLNFDTKSNILSGTPKVNNSGINIIGLIVVDTTGLADTLITKIYVESKLFPPSDVQVSDITNDNGHFLKLTWTSSPSEDESLVTCYRIFRSRSEIFSDIILLSQIESMYASIDLDSLKHFDNLYKNYTILIDSVAAGIDEYTDFVPSNNVEYYYWLQAVGSTGESEKVTTNIKTFVEKYPSKFHVSIPYPNPFNSLTTIQFEIPKECHVILKIYDILGREIIVLQNEYLSAGLHEAVWNGKDKNGTVVSTGIYLYKLTVDKYAGMGKVLFLK